MRSDFLPFALPDIGEAEIAEVVDTLRSGWITTGPKTRRFEQEFSAFLGADIHAVAVNSATAGLHLALEALGVGPGDEVITTTHTFTATAEVVRYLGADPVFVDVTMRDYCIDPAAVEKAITPRTKVIMPVHYAGHPCDMRRISDIAKRHNLHVVEDAAHAFPVSYDGRMIGALDSDITVFSFYATKTLATGEGGMLVTRNARLAERTKVMRLHGIDRDAFNRYSANGASWYYEVVAPGYKYNMTDIAASLGLHQLSRSRALAERREAMAGVYDQLLGDLPVVLPPRPALPGGHSWHLYVVLLDDDCSVGRDEVIRRMQDDGIGVSVHYVPLHRHPYWRDTYNLVPEQFGNSERLYGRMISLPLYTRMSEADQVRVATALRSATR